MNWSDTVIRCWSCNKLIVSTSEFGKPEDIDGSIVLRIGRSVECGCGASYHVEVTRAQDRARPMVAQLSEAEAETAREHARVWRG